LSCCVYGVERTGDVLTKPIIMWFRQDLRVSDHAALSAAAAAGPVLPVYILDDVTPGSWRWGAASRWWLHHSLEKLGESLPLLVREGEALQQLEKLITETNASALYFTRDYAPWSGTLERNTKDMCDRLGVACHRHGGFLLHEPESIRNGSGEFFKVYTPYSRACFGKGQPRPPKPNPKIEWAKHEGAKENLSSLNLLPTNPNWATGLAAAWTPGEAGAGHLLQRFLDDGLKGYAEGRDRADKQHVSRLSAHLHWGEISPHQVWQATTQHMAKAEGALDHDGEKFLKEVLWREFAYNLIHHVPTFPDKPFKSEYQNFPWADDPAALKKWQRGQTGFPIVDAGMRELWSTGIMHNRVRMIVASFLIKDLLIPWQEGERWFWDTLVDADIGNNAAGWQWVAGCGADASPYYRIFNPVLQGEKFDPHGAYVRRWVPELQNVPDEFIHRPWDMSVPPKDYPKRMVDHAAARDKALAAFKRIKKEDAS
jgi:deoxyribodipyrimidine photo-lyase